MLQMVPFVRKAMDSSELALMASILRETPRELMYSAALDVTKEMASYIKSNVPRLSMTNVISTLTPSLYIPFVSKSKDQMPLEDDHSSNQWITSTTESLEVVSCSSRSICKKVTMVDRSSSTDDLPSSLLQTYSTVTAKSDSSLPLLPPNSTGHEIAYVFIKSFLKIFLKVALTFILEVVILSLRLLAQWFIFFFFPFNHAITHSSLLHQLRLSSLQSKLFSHVKTYAWVCEIFAVTMLLMLRLKIASLSISSYHWAIISNVFIVIGKMTNQL